MLSSNKDPALSTPIDTSIREGHKDPLPLECLLGIRDIITDRAFGISGDSYECEYCENCGKIFSEHEIIP